MTANSVKKQVTINAEQRLYVIPSGGGGYSCWGFDNCFRETKELANRLARPAPAPEDLGTMKVYDYHNELIRLVAEHRIDLGTWFDSRTPKKVRDVLEDARHERFTVRIFLGHTEPLHPKYGQSWLEENDVYGRVGRSTGFLKVPLLVTPGEDGGGAILDSCIVKIMTNSGQTLYEHPAFNLPELTVNTKGTGDYPYQLLADGELHAGFKNEAKAIRLMQFLKGERMKP